MMCVSFVDNHKLGDMIMPVQVRVRGKRQFQIDFAGHYLAIFFVFLIM